MIERTEYQNIGIEDLDWAIYNWFDKIVDVHVKTPNNKLEKVPTLFASGERWATARDKRGIRDKNGVLILPLISIRRTAIKRDRTQQSLGTEQETLSISRQIDKKTNVVQNAISSRVLSKRNANKKVVHEITTIPFPDWCVTTYNCVIQTQYITQMNDILEKIFNSLNLQNSFVMPVDESKINNKNEDPNIKFDDRKIMNGYYFVGFLDTNINDAGNFDEFTDSERIVRYSFDITVPTYLQLDPEGKKPAVQVETTAYELKFPSENVKFVDDPLELEQIFSYKKLPK